MISLANEDETTATNRKAAFARFLVENGHTDIEFSDTHWAGIRRLMFTHAICVGAIGDFAGYDTRWCFTHLRGAQDALRDWKALGWLGEPVGWHRHPDTGRRRPGGDPAGQYVEW